MVEMLV